MVQKSDWGWAVNWIVGGNVYRSLPTFFEYEHAGMIEEEVPKGVALGVHMRLAAQTCRLEEWKGL